VTAAASGTAAALDVERYLAALDDAKPAGDTGAVATGTEARAAVAAR